MSDPSIAATFSAGVVNWLEGLWPLLRPRAGCVAAATGQSAIPLARHAAIAAGPAALRALSASQSRFWRHSLADNYVQFSQLLCDLKPVERAWLERMLSVPSQATLAAAGIHHDPQEEDPWPPCQWELQGDALWIYSQQSGDPHQVAQLICAFLKRYRKRACWQLSWSETCSRPRVGEFGGGGVFVTAQGSTFFHAHAWLQR